MKEFPDHLTPMNKAKFPRYRYERNLAYLRKEITELVLLGNENNYFELDRFSRTHQIKKDELEKMSSKIMEELGKLGWNTKTSFGGTGLFIYSTPEPPPSCFDGEF